MADDMSVLVTPNCGESTGWRPIERLRTHEQVLDRIEEEVVQGRLRPGDKLPPERQLAQDLGVSRAAVREALRVLESMGIIEAATGSGPGAGSIVVGHGTAAFANLLRLHLGVASFSQREVVEVRIQLERWACHEAATYATEANLAEVGAILSQMGRADVSPADFNQLDTDFHVSIAEISNNSLLALLMRGLRDAVQRQMVEVFETLEDVGEVMVSLCGEHRKILQALQAGNGSRAADLVAEHITHFYDGNPKGSDS